MTLFAWFITGVVLWTLLEWLIHNGLGHRGRRRTPFGREHVRHHATTSYFAPSWKKILAAAVVGAALWGGAQLVLRPLDAAALTAGLLLMYAAYEVIHRRCHTHAPKGRYGRWVRRHHFHHHFLDPRTNHGVSTAVWDIVFGTHRRVTAPIRVPRKAQVPWLIDPQTGEVRSQFAGDYVTAGRSGA